MKHSLTVVWLAWKDLWHDRRMTFCLVLTVASIAAPLLLFFGIKSGAMQVLRQRMINDPVFMELIPQGTAVYNAAWFDQWQNNGHVGFVVPRTRELGVSGEFLKAGEKGKGLVADMQPTAQGDWLLKSYGVAAPGPDACVLSAPLAEKLGLGSGDTVTVRISRTRKGGGVENGERPMRVEAVLPAQAGGRLLAFVPLPQLELMEDYRDGRAVPAFGWPGEPAFAPPVFPALMLYSQNAPDPVTLSRIQQRAGFVQMEEVAAPEGMPPDLRAFRLRAGITSPDLIKLNELRNLLRGEGVQVQALAEHKEGGQGLELSLALPGQSFALRSTGLWAALPGQPQTPPDEDWSDPARIWHSVILPAGQGPLPGNPVQVRISAPSGHSLDLKLRVLAGEDMPQGTAWVSPGLMGVLAHLHERSLAFEEGNGEVPALIRLGRRDYPRFRMYAASLDDVAPLAAQLEEAGVRVNTRVADIERVRLMDHYLGLLFAVIAAGSVAGGSVCLLSSLYANVERKRRELAVLRLLGVHGLTLCYFPLTGGMAMTMLGLGLGLGCFYGLGFFINHVAAGFTLAGETLCTLSLGQQLTAVGLGAGAALLAGLAASLRLLGIEPAECLRDE